MNKIIAAGLIAAAYGTLAFSQEAQPWTIEQAQELFEASSSSQPIEGALEGNWLFAAWAGKAGGEYDPTGIQTNILKPGNGIFHRRDLTTWPDYKTGSVRFSKKEVPLAKNKIYWSAKTARIHSWEGGAEGTARPEAGSVFFEEIYPDTLGEFSKDGRYKEYPAVQRYQYECRMAGSDALICQLHYEQKRTDTQTLIKESLEYRGFTKEKK